MFIFLGAIGGWELAWLIDTRRINLYVDTFICVAVLSVHFPRCLRKIEGNMSLRDGAAPEESVILSGSNLFTLLILTPMSLCTYF